jgi:hypothetical protein
MSKIRFTRRAVVTSVMAVGAVAAFMLPAAAAVSVQSESPAGSVISIKPSAVRKLNGAVVNLKVVITCDPANHFKQLTANITQAFPNGGIASGSMSTTAIACTGLPVVHSIPVTPNPVGEAFREGSAWASATFQACGYYGGCFDVTVDRAVTIANK